MSPKTARFVDRDEEMSEVRQILRSLCRGDYITHPIYEITGIGGIGKSSILAAVRAECRKSSLSTVFVDIAGVSHVDPDDWYATFAVSAARDIRARGDRLLRQALAQAQTDSKLDAFTPFAFSHAFLRRLVGHCARFPSVWIFDSLDNVPESALEHLADHLLSLADTGRSLIFFGTRKRLNWGTSGYKLQRKTRRKTLAPFDPDITASQMKRATRADLSAEVQAIACGNPAGTAAVLDSLVLIARQKHTRISRNLFAEVWPSLVDAAVSEIRERQIVPDTLFAVFYELAILRWFDMDLPVEFLSSLPAAHEWTHPASRAALISRMIGETCYVVHYDPVRGSYAMDDFVRRALSAHMRYHSVANYSRLHLIALEHYQARLRRSPSMVWMVGERLLHFAEWIAASQHRPDTERAMVQLIAQLDMDLRTCVGSLLSANSSSRYHRSFAHGIGPGEQMLLGLRSAIAGDDELRERISSIDVRALDAIERAIERAQDQLAQEAFA